MAKQKNTSNKKLHTKLLGQKKSRKQTAKELNKIRIRELNQLANKNKTEDQSEHPNIIDNEQPNNFEK